MKLRGVALLLAAAGLAGCLTHRVEQPALDDPTRELLRAGTIVYVDEGSLYRARGDGSDRKRILAAGEAGPGGRVITAALSADGRRAACLSLQSIDVGSGSGSHLTLHLLELSGAGARESHRVSLRELVPPGADGRHPVALIAPGLAWSADGGRLAVGLAPASGAGRVLVFDDGGRPLADLELATPGLSTLSSVSWGREAAWLAVGLLRQGSPEGAAEPVVGAVQVPPAGPPSGGHPSGTLSGPSTLRVLARGAYPALSPDGSRIAVVAPREGLSDLALLDEQGAEVTRFIRPAGKALNHPFWSGDGRFLYYYSLASTGPLGLVEVTILRCLDLRTRQVHDLARLT